MSDAILDVQDLVAGYGKMTILNGTSFSVPAGSITTVIGPNGAGKSTVFKAIFGLLKLREGRVVFNGRDVTGLSQRELLTCRHLLRAAGPQYLSRAVGAPQYRARRRRRRPRHHRPAGPHRSRARQISGAAPEGDAAGLDAVGRRAEAARDRARAAARSAAGADRRALDRAFAADGAADLRHPEGACATAASRS